MTEFKLNKHQQAEMEALARKFSANQLWDGSREYAKDCYIRGYITALEIGQDRATKNVKVLLDALSHYASLEVNGKDILLSLPDGWTTKNFKCDYGGKARVAIAKFNGEL